MTLYEWDEDKAQRNLRVHGISFEQATVALEDPDLIYLPDRVVDGELRHQVLGMAGDLALLLVAHTIRGEDDEIRVRIISARRAERWERELYRTSAGGQL